MPLTPPPLRLSRKAASQVVTAAAARIGLSLAAGRYHPSPVLPSRANRHKAAPLRRAGGVACALGKRQGRHCIISDYERIIQLRDHLHNAQVIDRLEACDYCTRTRSQQRPTQTLQLFTWQHLRRRVVARRQHDQAAAKIELRNLTERQISIGQLKVRQMPVRRDELGMARNMDHTVLAKLAAPRQPKHSRSAGLRIAHDRGLCPVLGQQRLLGGNATQRVDASAKLLATNEQRLALVGRRLPLDRQPCAEQRQDLDLRLLGQPAIAQPQRRPRAACAARQKARSAAGGLVRAVTAPPAAAARSERAGAARAGWSLPADMGSRDRCSDGRSGVWPARCAAGAQRRRASRSS